VSEAALDHLDGICGSCVSLEACSAVCAAAATVAENSDVRVSGAVLGVDASCYSRSMQCCVRRCRQAGRNCDRNGGATHRDAPVSQAALVISTGAGVTVKACSAVCAAAARLGRDCDRRGGATDSDVRVSEATLAMSAGCYSISMQC
jgi:hypothetical protein